MSSTTRIAEIIRPTIEALGFDLVRVKFTGADRSTLQIMAEPSGGGEMIVEDCADISRALSALLDVEDPISEAYELEVSSPGLDRPLVTIADFERFTGYVAKVEMKTLADGRKRFRGRIRDVKDDVVRLEMQNGEVASLAFDKINEAKLVVTDELIAKALRTRDAADVELDEDVSENA
jgi:ribosome maturation factor RimP